MKKTRIFILIDSLINKVTEIQLQKCENKFATWVFGILNFGNGLNLCTKQLMTPHSLYLYHCETKTISWGAGII